MSEMVEKLSAKMEERPAGAMVLNYLDSSASPDHLQGMTEPYHPHYRWEQTRIPSTDPPLEDDWCGYDGTEYIGRVRRNEPQIFPGRWTWGGTRPSRMKGSTPMPHSGFTDTARQSVQLAEEYWQRCLLRMAD